MSATGLAVFDKTLQTTNIWLNEIMEVIGPDRQAAWKVLTVVLHTLRDRLPVEAAAHLGAQLPLMVRGVYYDQFQPHNQPTDCKTVEEFTAAVQDRLSDIRPVDAKDATRAVFAVLARHLPEGEIAKIKSSLPRSLRSSFETAEAVFDRGTGRAPEPRPGAH